MKKEKKDLCIVCGAGSAPDKFCSDTCEKAHKTGRTREQQIRHEIQLDWTDTDTSARQHINIGFPQEPRAYKDS